MVDRRGTQNDNVDVGAGTRHNSRFATCAEGRLHALLVGWLELGIRVGFWHKSSAEMHRCSVVRPHMPLALIGQSSRASRVQKTTFKIKANF